MVYVSWPTLKVEFIQSCFFDLDILASVAVLWCPLRGERPSLVYGRLVSPRTLTLHLLVAAKGSWGKGTRPRSDRGIRTERSAVYPLSTVTSIVWRNTHKPASLPSPETHTHTIAACPLLSQYHCSVSPIVTPPNTGKHRQWKMDLHTQAHTLAVGRVFCFWPAEHEPGAGTDMRQRRWMRDVETAERKWRYVVMYSKRSEGWVGRGRKTGYINLLQTRAGIRHFSAKSIN